MMDTNEDKLVVDPALQEDEKPADEIPQEDGKAPAKISSPSKESEVVAGAKEKETEANQGEKDQENHGKEIADTDAEDEKDKGEVMAGKKRHLIGEATLFPMFFTMFGFRLVAGNDTS